VVFPNIIIMMCVVSSWAGEYSSHVPDGLRVTLDCPMRSESSGIVGCCERGLV